MKPNPYVLSFIACDDIIPDARNGNHSIINVFHDIIAAQYPCLQPRLAVFVELTNGHGLTPIEVRLVHEPSQSRVFSMQGSADFSDPRAVASLYFQVAPLMLVSPGEYRLQLLRQNELIIERRITAHLIPPGEEQKDT